MAILSVDIINSYVSSEGSNGFLTNYVDYTVLVRYTGGEVSLMNVRSGSAQMQSLLPYVRTPQDILVSVRDAVNNVKNDLNTIVNEKMDYVINSCYPLPYIKGKVETDAIREIREAGLIPVLKNTYPAGTPENGIVTDYQRDPSNFRQVITEIIHTIPDVTGKNKDEAENILKREGFFIRNVSYQINTNGEAGKILSCTRDNENSLYVTLVVCSAALKLESMDEEEAISAIKACNFSADVHYEYSTNVAPGKVISWENKENNRILLNISKGTSIISFNKCTVNVNSALSPDDFCRVTVTLNRQEKQWEVILHYQSSCKQDRTIEGVSSKTLYGKNSIQITSINKTIKGNVNNNIALNIPEQNTDVPPTSISFVLTTHYGTLVKKTDDISVTLTLEK